MASHARVAGGEAIQSGARALKERAIRTGFQVLFSLFFPLVMLLPCALKGCTVRTSFSWSLFLGSRSPHDDYFRMISQIHMMSARPPGPPPLGCQKRKLRPLAGVFSGNAVVRVSFWPASGVPATFTHLSP